MSERPTRRQFLQGAAATAGAIALGPTLWTRPGWAQAAPPGSPRLAFGADPATSMTVSWSTPGVVATPQLSYGLDPSLGATLDASSGQAHGSLLHPGPATNYHHARITGLQPATTYHYRTSHQGGLSEVLTFTTAPAGPQPFTFTAFGDQGVKDGGALVTALVADIKPAFNLVAGDLCYADNLGTGLVIDDLVAFAPETWDQWFAQGAASMQASPWMPALGNHDMEPMLLPLKELGYRDHDVRLAVPEGGPSTYVYSFRYGNVGVLALDANDVSVEIPTMKGYTGGAQTAWLDSELGTLRADPSIDFIVAYFHHCAYCSITSHSSDGGVRDAWVPIFEHHNVDLVINGHNHGYERTAPIRSNALTEMAPAGASLRSDVLGTTYICAGSGGKANNHFGEAYVSRAPAGAIKEMEASPWSMARVTGNAFIKVDVTPPDADRVTTMAITAIAPAPIATNSVSAAAAGTVIDSVTLVRQRVVTPPVAPPVQTPALPAVAPVAVDKPQLPRTGGRRDIALPAALIGAGALGAAAAARAAAAAKDAAS